MAFSFKKVFGSLQTNSVLSPSAVGIDIGRSSIKVVELERNAEAPILKTYGEIQLGPYQELPVGAMVKHDAKLLENAIVDVFREAGVTASDGVLSLPLSAGFVTVIKVTLGKNEDLENRIPVEARKYVPLPLQEITLDWAPIGPPETSSRNEVVQPVLLVALQNEVVVTYRNLLSNIKLDQQPMELATFSAARAIGAFSDEHTALIDMGASVTKLYIYRKGTLAAIHRFTAASEMVTRKLSELWSVDFAVAEERKRTLQQPNDEADVRRVVSAVYEPTVREVAQVLQRYETQYNCTLETVQLSGGAARTVGVDGFLSEGLQRKIVFSFPFSHVGYPAFMEDVLREIGPTFTNSLGAALRQLQ